MSATENTTIHADADLLMAISKAHGDTDAMLAARVKHVRSAVSDGVKTSTIADDLAALKADDPTVNAVSSTILGFAVAASGAVDLAGVAFSSVKVSDLATLYRGAKNVKVKAFNRGIREALKTLPDDATPADRFAVVMTTAETARTTRTSTAPKTREAHSQGGMSGGSDETGETATTTPAAPVASAPIDGIRAAVRYLQQGGELTADMRSAIAELTAAASAAGKRQRNLAAA